MQSKNKAKRPSGRLAVNAATDEPSKSEYGKGNSMAHNIEQFEDGSAAFVSNREVAWHNLGTIVDGAMTAEEALNLAQLNWEVKVSQNCVRTEVDGQTLQIDDKFFTYRNHPKAGLAPLGIVGQRYVPIQNKDAFSFLNHLVDDYGAVFETAGSLRNGRQVFMSMKMPESIKVEGNADTVDMYVMATNSHDGSIAFTAAVTPIRPVCTNTVNLALKQATSKAKFKHTLNATEKVQQARELMSIVTNYSQEFQNEVERLLNSAMTDLQFEKFVEQMFPLRKGDESTQRAITKVENKRDELRNLWTAPTQTIVGGTNWAAYNAVAEYVDWVMPVRGDTGTDRAERIVTGGADYMKQKAYALLAK